MSFTFDGKTVSALANLIGFALTTLPPLYLGVAEYATYREKKRQQKRDAKNDDMEKPVLVATMDKIAVDARDKFAKKFRPHHFVMIISGMAILAVKALVEFLDAWIDLP